MAGRWTVLFVSLLAGAALADNIPPSCESKVYCQGELLDKVQLAVPALYDDSKTFVDMKQKNSQNVTLQNFNALMSSTGGNPTREEIKVFVNANFEAGNELEISSPQDWKPEPKMLSKITNDDLRDWARNLNVLWKNLTRKVISDVKENSDKYSLLYVPNSFVIPGGRFKELYYWDTYWIVRGLLLCEMNSTVSGIIENFLYMQKNYGIIPNGGRVYYLQRSQPPFLTPMMWQYYTHTGNLEFVSKHIETLEEEFKFWMKNRTVQVHKNGKSYIMARYYAVSSGPRPESYREDVEQAESFTTQQRREEFYIDIKSGAESGWDFSGRWFNKDGTNKGNLTHIDTHNIIPVDLNALIYWNADLLSKMFFKLGDTSKYENYKQIAEYWKISVNEVLWDDMEGSWFDYDIRNNISRPYFYPSDFTPLWTGCYNQENAAVIANKVVEYITKNHILLDYMGGVPTSLDQTGEQWDMPNAWPPLQIIVIQGLANTNIPSAMDLAKKLAEKWVRANFKGYQETEEMFEKYDANNPGKFGGGGEYTVQSGFGWTNGIIFELLDTYGETLTPTDSVQKRSITLREILSSLSTK